MVKFDDTNVAQSDSPHSDANDSIADSRVADHQDAVGGVDAIVYGSLLAAAFYGTVYATAWAPLERYFLGHPVAIAATILFCIAIAILSVKYLATRRQWRLLDQADDQTLAPVQITGSPSQEYFNHYDAGYVARHWSKNLAGLSKALGRSQLVVRLREVLMRQSGRGTTKHLADDLRELSARDADSAHESFALVRIIVWAIPMLGFLGTVIGITQTLGGLDFSDGNAAVDNLKSGLYVAFDTTALGLVLSIVAIFLQFPVERSEQQLLAAIDERVGYLTGVYLPGDEAADNQFELVAALCEGVQAAVAESLSSQTKLWRQTIDEAQGHWQKVHDVQTRGLVSAIEGTLAPALRDHSGQLALAGQRNQELLEDQFDRWQTQLAQWQQTMVSGAEAMTRQQETMLDQVNQAALIREQVTSVLELQKTLDSNLERLDHTNRRIDENMGAAAGQGMADAMMVLARTMDVLTNEMAQIRDDRGRRERAA